MIRSIRINKKVASGIALAAIVIAVATVFCLRTFGTEAITPNTAVKLKSDGQGFMETCLVFGPAAELDRTVEPGDVLYLSFAVHPDAWEEDATFRFSARVIDGGHTRTLFSKVLSPGANKRHRGWKNQEISLDKFAGRNVTVQLVSEPHVSQFFRTSGRLKKWMLWGGVRVGNLDRKPGELNVILISLDTLRADHLGVAGYRRPTSPNLDALARTGAYFREAVAQAAWTIPSHMSVFTGLYPSYHGMMRLPHLRPIFERELSGKVPTMTEVLRENGYLTQAITGSGYVSSHFGFYRGFDRYVETAGEKDTDADFIFGEGMKWIEKHRNRKFFLFLHTYEIHAPYLRKYFSKDLTSPTKLEQINARYDGDIHYTDDYIGQLKSELERLDLAKNTLLVVFSDHGEDLGDRGTPIKHKHGHRLYEELLRVVLIFSLPGQIPAVSVDGQEARLIDIFPTILDLLGIPFRTADPLAKVVSAGPDGIKPVLQGRSLVPVMKDRHIGGESWSLSEGMEFDQEMKAIRFLSPREKVKLIYHDEKPPRFQFFNLKDDPMEKTSLDLPSSGIGFEMKKVLEAYMKGIPRDEDLKGSDAKADPELSEKLRSLGY